MKTPLGDYWYGNTIQRSKENVQVYYNKEMIYIKPISDTQSKVWLSTNGDPNLSSLVPKKLVTFVIKKSAAKLVNNIRYYCPEEEFPPKTRERLVTNSEFYKGIIDYDFTSEQQQ